VLLTSRIFELHRDEVGCAHSIPSRDLIAPFPQGLALKRPDELGEGVQRKALATAKPKAMTETNVRIAW
jgi:hypothetical protein